MSTVFPEVLALPMQERAALVEEHVREGLPMYVWRDGKVAAVPAEELLEKS
jgi:hypothetical protein